MDRTTVCVVSFAVSFASVFQYSIPLAVLAGVIAFLITWQVFNLIEYYKALRWHSHRKEDIYIYAKQTYPGVNKWIKRRVEWHEKMLDRVNRLGDHPEKEGKARPSMRVQVIPIYFQDYMAPRETEEEYLIRAKKEECYGHKKRNIKLNGNTNESREWYIDQVLSGR